MIVLFFTNAFMISNYYILFFLYHYRVKGELAVDCHRDSSMYAAYIILIVHHGDNKSDITQES